MRREVSYLGHLISDQGVAPNPEKIKSVSEFPIPKTDKNIKQFLGLCGYYRKFVKDFSKLAIPLNY